METKQIAIMETKQTTIMESKQTAITETKETVIIETTEANCDHRNEAYCDQKNQGKLTNRAHITKIIAMQISIANVPKTNKDNNAIYAINCYNVYASLFPSYYPS